MYPVCYNNEMIHLINSQALFVKIMEICFGSKYFKWSFFHIIFWVTQTVALYITCRCRHDSSQHKPGNKANCQKKKKCFVSQFKFLKKKNSRALKFLHCRKRLMQFQTEVNALISVASNKEAGLFIVFIICLKIIKTSILLWFINSSSKNFY